ncbi:hypothetical protein AGMMS49546_05060 [Spirochaetia bacterium]|nr:hypothetical protein AGMMS49546_05060 [Spirochaetia bacterium]
MIKLSIKALKEEASKFSILESKHDEPSLFGSSDGKAVGTYLEHKFQHHLEKKYSFITGNSASGIDFPDDEINTDIKTTSITQPQSSCPFKSARQKIFGLGYNLLVFVYSKEDDSVKKVSRLNILHTVFVEKIRTADYQLTTSIQSILRNNGNKDDLLALFFEKNLPVDEIEAGKIADEVMKCEPNIGYLTISNALQWRLQYGRIIEKAGSIQGIFKLK